MQLKNNTLMNYLKILTTLFVLFGWTCTSFSQVQTAEFHWQGKIYDVIKTEDVTMNQGLGLTATEQQVLNVMGTPDSVDDVQNDLTGHVMTLLLYENSYFYFQEDKIHQLDINSDNVVFHFNGQSFKVGDYIGPLEALFPNSFSAHEDVNTIVVNLGYIDNGELKASEIDLIIRYDINDKIKRIMVMHRP